MYNLFLVLIDLGIALDSKGFNFSFCCLLLSFFSGTCTLTMEVVMISQESTAKDVKLVGYDFSGHTRGALVVGIACGCPYYKGSAIFSVVVLSTTSEKSFIP